MSLYTVSWDWLVDGRLGKYFLTMIGCETESVHKLIELELSQCNFKLEDNQMQQTFRIEAGLMHGLQQSIGYFLYYHFFHFRSRKKLK